MIYYHFAELIHRQAEKYGNRTALKHRDKGTREYRSLFPEYASVFIYGLRSVW